MQLLEMEVADTPVTARNRRKLNNRSAAGKDPSFLDALARNNFISKVLIIAAIAIISLIHMASLDSPARDASVEKVKINTVPQHAPVEATIEPESAPVEETAEPRPAPVEDTTQPASVEAPANPEPAPVETLDEPQSTPVETTSNGIESEPSHVEPSTEPGKELFEDGEYVYSKFAKVNALYDHELPDEDKKKELAEKYGKWNFWDGDEEGRPANDYMAKFPNRDIPGDDLPEDAWQADAVFVNHYLNDADKLIKRAMEAIYSEYGHEKPTDPDAMIERMKLLRWTKIDIANENPPAKYARRGDRSDGGWTTKRSYDGLVRRLLHAMMTSDTFTVVMGGHSAAAGQGNHFRQSYMMQFHKVMEPIFARLGVKLVTRNVGMGGLGTIHNGLGSGSIYGDTDILIWDSGMTESNDIPHIDIFLRQGLIGGNRVPILWGGSFDLLKMLHEEADADVGEFGFGQDLATEAKSKEHYDSLPYASKGLKCKEDIKDLCDTEPRFCAKCWIDRDDGIKPDRTQLKNPKGQVKWHPGWRHHQLTGRNIAMGVLAALQSAVNLWTENVKGGPPLDDQFWHVTDYYNNIREKVKKLNAEHGQCYKGEYIPDRFCNTPMKARTQYTPRANFHETSINSIIKPTENGYIPKNEKVALYEGADAHNECFDLPESYIDIFDVNSARRRLSSTPVSVSENRKDINSYNIHLNGVYNRTLEGSGIIPGKGWDILGEPQGYCDGTYNAICSLQTDNECALYGHHDARGAIIGNEFSGWLVLTLKDLNEGLVAIKLHTWHYESESTITKDWTTVNNERGKRQLREGTNVLLAKEERRNLGVRKTDTVELPDTFEFDYAIDGKITTLKKNEFLGKNHHIQRVVELLTLLDDENFTSEKKDVEVAIRMRGCGRVCTFGLSHIYWA